MVLSLITPTPSFEYAVVPCRTLCCGKIFCTEHLADVRIALLHAFHTFLNPRCFALQWLHGPNAEGRCPNCENACSLEGSTLSLATPSLRSTSQTSSSRRNTLQPAKPAYPSSPLSLVQPRLNDTLNDPHFQSRSEPTFTSGSMPPAPSASRKANAASKTPVSWVVTSPSTTSSSSAASSEIAVSSDEDLERHRKGLDGLGLSSSTMNLSTTPFSASWGAVSRLMSIITFLMFLYKLLS